MRDSLHAFRIYLHAWNVCSGGFCCCCYCSSCACICQNENVSKPPVLLIWPYCRLAVAIIASGTYACGYAMPHSYNNCARCIVCRLAGPHTHTRARPLHEYGPQFTIYAIFIHLSFPIMSSFIENIIFNKSHRVFWGDGMLCDVHCAVRRLSTRFGAVHIDHVHMCCMHIKAMAIATVNAWHCWY